jgi:hypothetical protein
VIAVPYILILIAAEAHGVTTQVFGSQQACTQALVAAKKIDVPGWYGSEGVGGTCVPKGESK